MNTLATRIRTVRNDQLMVNSALTFTTTVMMAGAGALFWVIAARLATPHDVGLAGSLVASADSLALFAQLGLNIAIVRTLPRSTRQASDVVVAVLLVLGAGALFAFVYAILLPLTSPKLAEVVGSPWSIALYCTLVALGAVNVLTDNVFLSINRVWSYLQLNGILMGLAKCVLPFLLAGAGALGLYGSVGGAIALCSVASVWVILRHLPGPRTLSPSPHFLGSLRFAGAGYVTAVLWVLPLLVFPILVINALGSAAGAAYFVAYQVVTLQNAVILSLANAAYAEAERAQTGRHAVVRKAGLTLMGFAVLASLAMFVLAPFVLWIFGGHYADAGTSTLRVLSFATIAVAFNCWGAIRLRLSHHLRAMILVQLASTAVMLVLAVLLAPLGTEWLGVAWGIGHLVGGALGYVVTRTVARYADEAPAPTVRVTEPDVMVTEGP